MQTLRERLNEIDDYFRPEDVGMSIDTFRSQLWWLTEYGDSTDPYYSRSEMVDSFPDS
ncbi:MAG TPA: hypothetical protein PKD64_18655 [Pirellulaceae bacterium]|nr:hypothetical protein [Pirellulaceae bacterium]HMO94212.1 hypothetical protein [Pirellulaceae bacterium]